MNISDFKHDLLGLQSFAERLERFIPIEHDFVEGSLVIALSSRFGSGKSTFLRMWRNRLEAGHADSFKPVVVELNAWESDYYGDPLFAIVSSLVKALKGRHEKDSAQTIVNAAKDIGWLATAVAGQFVDKVTGIDLFTAGKIAEEKKANREGLNAPVDAFSMFESRKCAMQRLRLAIENAVVDASEGVLFLVDELDRCRPDYAIAYLETVKHIFDVPKATFILAIDRGQLENSAKTAFGPNLDFDEYLRKFVKREILLPQASAQSYEELTGAYIDHYLNRLQLRFSSLKTGPSDVEPYIDLIFGLKLSPRQLQEMFRVIGHLTSTSEAKQGRMRHNIGRGSVMMAALKIGKPEIYHQVGQQSLQPQAAVDFLRLTVKPRSVEPWFLLLYTGDGLAAESGQDLNKLLIKVGLLKEGHVSWDAQGVRQLEADWAPFDENAFGLIYQKIEEVSQWG